MTYKIHIINTKSLSDDNITFFTKKKKFKKIHEKKQNKFYKIRILK